MKNESAYVRKFAAVFKKLPAPEAPLPQRDPVTQMVLGFLQWEATHKQAENAFKRIMHTMVDNNDLRVSHAYQIIELIGPNYPRVEERVARMKDALQEIYVREHAIHPNSVAEKSKKDIKTYYDTLPGMTPYVSALVLMTCYGAHCIPCDQRLAAKLKEEGAIDKSATPEQIEHFLERQVKAGEAIDAHQRLQAWSDEGLKKEAVKKPAPARKPGAKRPAPKAKKPAKAGKKR